jgi:hypothetical protein
MSNQGQPNLNNNGFLNPQCALHNDTLIHLQQDVRAIKDALLGTEFKQIGLIQQVNEHETKLVEMENKATLGKGALWAIGVCGPVIGGLLVMVIDSLKK